MNLQISGQRMEVTAPIREFVEKKLVRINRHFDHVIDTRIVLSAEPKRHRAEITMRVPGKDLHCESVQEDLYAAIDVLMDKADRKVIEYKNKMKSRSHESIKRQIIDEDADN